MEHLDDYKLVEGIDLSAIEKRVNELIGLGYVPQPMLVAPAVIGATSRNRFVVPMVRSITFDTSTEH